MVRKLLTDKPATAVAIMKHVFEQEYKHPEKRKLMNKYWNQNVHLVELMLEIGKHKGRKDDVKLLQCVNKVKQKYNSLRQACRLTDISWTKFHRHTYVNSTSASCKNGTYVNCLRNRFTQSRLIINQKIFHFHYLIRNTRGKGS